MWIQESNGGPEKGFGNLTKNMIKALTYQPLSQTAPGTGIYSKTTH